MYKAILSVGSRERYEHGRDPALAVRRAGLDLPVHGTDGRRRRRLD